MVSSWLMARSAPLASLRAVRFLAAQKTGLFDMFDVLGLH